MLKKSSHTDTFIRLFQEELLVWSQHDELSLILAEPPLTVLSNATIASASQPLLKAKRGRRSLVEKNLMSWPALGLQAKPNPFLAIVLEGVADLSVGVTEAMSKKSGQAVPNGLYQIRSCAKCVLLYPSDVPTSDGIAPHWSDANTVQPDSTVLWIDILPEGAILHTCSTRDCSHTVGSFQFVFGQFSAVVHAMREELRSSAEVPAQRDVSLEIAQSMLRTALLQISKSLAGASYQVAPDYIQRVEKAGVNSDEPKLVARQSSAVKRACAYIHGCLTHDLSVEKIAGQAFVSPAQLNRLFRAELQTSVMQYVTEQRLNSAKSLLVNTTLPVNVIGENVGIKNSVYFTDMFHRKAGLSPTEYRLRNKGK